MQQKNKIYFHGFQSNESLVRIINKLQDMDVPFYFVNQNTPKNIVDKFQNIEYNPSTHFLCLFEIDGQLSFNKLDSICSFKNFFNSCTAELAELVN